MNEKGKAQPSDQEEVVPMSLPDATILPAYPAIGNPKECAIALGIPEGSVRELCRTGQLRAFKCGSLWKIPKAWLLEFIERGGCLNQQAASKRGGGASCRTL